MRLVLFDVDGTLLIARGAGRRALGRALEQVFGTAGSLDTYDFRGRTDIRIVLDVLEAGGIPRTDARERLDEVFERYAQALTVEIGDGSGVVTLPGIAALVPRLGRTEGVLLGLLTGNIEHGARIKLAPTGLWPLFPVGAFGSDDHDRGRLPSLAARRAHALTGRVFEPHEVVVIGDTPHDIECARAFGAVAVGVATGFHRRDELLAEKPDLFFDDFADVDRAVTLLSR